MKVKVTCVKCGSSAEYSEGISSCLRCVACSHKTIFLNMMVERICDRCNFLETIHPGVHVEAYHVTEHRDCTLKIISHSLRGRDKTEFHVPVVENEMTQPEPDAVGILIQPTVEDKAQEDLLSDNDPPPPDLAGTSKDEKDKRKTVKAEVNHLEIPNHMTIRKIKKELISLKIDFSAKATKMELWNLLVSGLQKDREGKKSK